MNFLDPSTVSKVVQQDAFQNAREKHEGQNRKFEENPPNSEAFMWQSVQPWRNPWQYSMQCRLSR